MLNALVVRYCAKCGRKPVSTFSADAKVCDNCAVEMLMEAMQEGFSCPRCKTAQEITLFSRFICPNCGYVEEQSDD